MSEFKNVNFVNEFAYRTMLNYYHQKERFGKDEDERVLASEKISQIKESMLRRGYDISDYYEITDLINSLVGLFVFPEQAAFNSIPTEEEKLKTDFPCLYNCVIKDKKYINTYRSDPEEKNSPRDICRHIKNSLSHKKVMVEPHSGTIGNRRQITAITFKDSKINYQFKLTINICDLENVVMEICNHLINIKG